MVISASLSLSLSLSCQDFHWTANISHDSISDGMTSLFHRLVYSSSGREVEPSGEWQVAARRGGLPTDTTI